MNQFFERRYSTMPHLLNNVTFQEHYNIRPGLGNKLLVDVNKTDNANEMKFIVRYIEPFDYDIFELPIEISRVISSYLSSYVTIEFVIAHQADYPFSPPRWSVDNVKHNLHSHSIDILEYYQYITQKHNDRYRKDWSPAIQINTDLLDFFQKIHHFEYIVHPETFTK
jgi:hypothetical protein